MNKDDFVRIIGRGTELEYVPVAGMLQNGYGFAGYFHGPINENLGETMILVNARLVDLREKTESRSGPRVADFNEFVEEIVARNYGEGQSPDSPRQDLYGKSIPLAAFNLAQVTVLYPISQIGKLMTRIGQDQQRLPTFLDFDNRSVILKALRTELW